MINLRDEIIVATNLRQRAYAPYSHFTVGACLQTKNGNRYSGCNVENAGLLSICAERVAFTKAISEGEKYFDKIVIIGGKEGEDAEKTLPCGYCRQFMSEFVDKDFRIYVVYDSKVEEYSMEELLPYGFELKK